MERFKGFKKHNNFIPQGLELILNGAFDKDIANWTANGTPLTLEWSAGRAHIIGDSSNDGMYQRPNLKAGKNYTFKYDLEVIANSAATNIKCAVYLAGPGYLAVADYTTLGTFKGSIDFKSPASGQCYVWFFQTGTSNTEFYVDNVSLLEF